MIHKKFLWCFHVAVEKTRKTLLPDPVSELCFQVEKIEESFDLINAKPKPLAAYLFTKNKKLQEKFVANVPAGGMLVNDTVLHVSSASP